MNPFAECKRVAEYAIKMGWAKLPVVMTEDAYKEMRRKKNLEVMRKLRQRWKEQGLTTNGKQRTYRPRKAAL